MSLYYRTYNIYGNDVCIKQIKKDYPKIGRRIARGGNSIIYEGSKPNTVFKLTVDPAAWWALADPYFALKGKHFLKLIQAIGEVGESTRRPGMPLYLMEIERLENPRGRSKASFAYRHLSRKYDYTINDSVLRGVEWICHSIKEKRVKGSLKTALLQIVEFIQTFDCYPDIHAGNIMRRGDIWVFSDPVASRDVVKY